MNAILQLVDLLIASDLGLVKIIYFWSVSLQLSSLTVVHCIGMCKKTHLS